MIPLKCKVVASHWKKKGLLAGLLVNTFNTKVVLYFEGNFEGFF